MIFITKSEEETRKLSSKVISELDKLTFLGAKIVLLEGELGAGKTVFSKGFAKELKIKAKIKSPTFVLMKKYKIPAKKSELKNRYLYHLDCYRLRDWHDLVPLGFKDILKDKNAIVLIEWPERINPALPKKYVRVHIDHLDNNKRKIKIT